MNSYTVRDRSGAGEILDTVEADDVTAAATAFAQKRHGQQARILRRTGETGMSGVFNAYVPSAGGSTAIGDPFHVRG